MAAWLIAGPTPNLEQDFRQAVAEAGLAMSVNTGWWSTTLTLTGSSEHLDQALWLAYQRLLPTPPTTAEMAADVQQGLWYFDETLLRSVRSPAGSPDDALLAAMLGGVGGRSAFLSMAAAHNRSADSFSRLARLALDTAQARLHVVAAPGSLEQVSSLLHFHESVLAASEPHTPPQPTPLSQGRLPNPVYIELDNQMDGHEKALAGWRLHTPRRLDDGNRLERDAKMLVLQAWFEHEGGAFKQA